MPADARSIRVPAMGTAAHLVLVGADGALATHLLDLLGRLERRWSRFLPDLSLIHI